VASLEGKHLVVFYYFSKSEIWSEKRGGLWWDETYKKGHLKSGLKKGDLWCDGPYMRGSTEDFKGFEFDY
jgi:hypothetical protein